MLRHWTFKCDMPSIIKNGLMPGDVLGKSLRRHDKGEISFEKDPPTTWLGENIGALKCPPRTDPTIALDFDEERLRADFQVRDYPRQADNDLSFGYGTSFKNSTARKRHVGDYVKVKPLTDPPCIPLTYLTEECKARLRKEGYSL